MGGDQFLRLREAYLPNLSLLIWISHLVFIYSLWIGLGAVPLAMLEHFFGQESFMDPTMDPKMDPARLISGDPWLKKALVGSLHGPN